MRNRERDNTRARAKRIEIDSYKIKVGCVDCGYNSNPAALEFDHKDNSGIPNSGKQKTVASLMYNSWKVIWNEISKCEVVCANCHAIRTANRRNNARMMKLADMPDLESGVARREGANPSMGTS